MAIADDFSIAANGDIRYTPGSTANYTVIALHRWLGDLMDDAQASGNDILDITDATASERSTDNIITLKYPYNIDEIAARHLYDGSIVQSETSSNLGENIYDGILVFATAGAYLYIIQNGKVVTPNFWTTGLNADATAGISHRFMLKVRNGGTDIDGRRLVGVTHEFSKTYSEFKIGGGTSRGNNVMAVTYATDLNNATSAATVKGWTTISNTEGYRLIDVNNDGLSENYYSEWNKATYTINQFYERIKWLSRRATSEDLCADTGSDFIVGNATINGQGQSFTVGANAVYGVRVFTQLKKVGSPTGNIIAKLYLHSGTYGTSSVPLGPIAVVASAPTAGGTGYTVNDVLNVSEGTGGQVTATTVNAGVVEVVTFTTAGTGYTTGTGKATTGGTGTGCTISITGLTAQATSVNVDVSKLTTSYQTVELGFDTQYKMTASTNCVVTFEYTTGDASNYVHVKGLATTGTHSGNRSQKNGSWVATAADDLYFDIYTSPELYGKSGELIRGITHEIIVDTLSTTFNATEPISWTGGTGLMFAQKFIDTTAITINVVAAAGTFTRTAGSYLTNGFRPGMTIVTSGFTNGGNNTTKIISTVTATVITVTSNSGLVDESGDGDEYVKAGHMWMQLLSGVIPTDNQVITGGTSTATCQVNVTVTERTLSFPLCGASTGSAIIGSYGFGIEYADLTANDKLFDLTDTQRIPPNNVTFTVGGLVSTEDRVLMGPASGGVLQENQLTLSTTLNGATETAVVCTASIPIDTPSSGTIRIQLDTGIYRRVPYTSFSGTTFTIGETNFTDPNDATSGNNIYISYIDKIADDTTATVTWVYSSDRSVFIRVRDGGASPIKTFETTGTMGSAGGSSTVIRTADV